ncbi:MAG: hypothetical protein KGI27_08580 [Thaumarchaeota archaeon]|nr:hypothetical protein [Nitrososphaerota archaeon]
MADEGTVVFLFLWAIIATIVVIVLIRRNKRTALDLPNLKSNKQKHSN